MVETDALIRCCTCRKEPNWGGFGEAEMKWYALWVNTTHEEEVGMDLASNIGNLGTVEDASGTRVERIVKHWVPTKMAMKWNGRYESCILLSLTQPLASAHLDSTLHAQAFHPTDMPRTAHPVLKTGLYGSMGTGSAAQIGSAVDYPRRHAEQGS